jgi:predicted outer membrane repeat protein
LTILVAQDTVYVPQDYPTIQQGIDAAVDGNVVLVDTGTYLENINFKGKAITVASHFLRDGDTSHINNTIIDGSQPAHPDSASVVYFTSGEDTNSVIYGFTIQNGQGTLIGQTNNIIGGGICCDGSGPSIEHNRIIDNSCEGIGAHLLGGGIAISGMPSKIINNYISGNSCITSDAGADYVAGGGISVWSTGLCRIENNIISNNTIYHGASGQALGGGIFLFSAQVSIRNNTIDNNHVENTGNSYQPWGGGIYGETIKFDSEITGNRISNNILTSMASGTGGGIGLWRNIGPVLVDRNIFINNQAKRGGGLAVDLFLELKIINNLFSQNSATYRGGGIYFSGGGGATVPLVVNNTIYDNSCPFGGAIYNNSTMAFIAFNNILIENSSGSEVYLSEDASAFLYYNDLDVDMIDGDGTWEGGDNIFEDPLFDDDSCHLNCYAYSPCINEGTFELEISGEYYYAPLHDFEGENRPMDYYMDIGADEQKICTGLRETESQYLSDVEVYPNPTEGIFDLQFTVYNLQSVSIKLYDLHGREVAMVVDRQFPAGEHIVKFDASRLPAGVYFCRARVGEEIETIKMIVL